MMNIESMAYFLHEGDIRLGDAIFLKILASRPLTDHKLGDLSPTVQLWNHEIK